MNKTWIVRSLSLLLAMIMVFGNAVTAAAASELAPSAENAIAESAQDETEETEGSAEAKPAGAENTAEAAGAAKTDGAPSAEETAKEAPGTVIADTENTQEAVSSSDEEKRDEAPAATETPAATEAPTASAEKLDEPAPTEAPAKQEPISGKESTDEAPTSTETPAAPAMPAFTAGGTAGNGVSVSVSAAEGVFPEGTTMTVEAAAKDAVISAAQAVTPNRVVDAAAVNISFFDASGREIEPADDASVSVTLQAGAGSVEGREFLVVHISDSMAAERVTAVSGLSGECASFLADEFSIYAIIGTDPSDDDAALERITYRIYDAENGNLLSTQIVKTGDTLAEPQLPDPEEGKSFLGWFTLADGAYQSFTGFEGYIRVPDTNTDTVVNVFPRYGQLFTVQFRDTTQDDAIIDTISGEYVAGSTTVSLTEINKRTVDAGADSMCTGWALSKEAAMNAANKLTADLTIPSAGSLDLYPVIEAGHRLYFDSNDSSVNRASIVTPQYLYPDDTTVDPGDAVRVGYQFLGWFTEKDGGEKFSFGSTLSANTKLFAHWAPIEVTYNVIYWTEILSNGPTGTHDAMGADGSFDESKALWSRYAAGQATALTGSIVKVEETDMPGSVTVPKYYDFYRSAEKEVAGDGSTEVNVYFRLHVYTFRWTWGPYTANDGTVKFSIRTNRDGVILPDENGNGSYQINAVLGERVTDVTPVIELYGENIDPPAFCYGWACPLRTIYGFYTNTTRNSIPYYWIDEMAKGDSFYAIYSREMVPMQFNYWYENAENDEFAPPLTDNKMRAKNTSYLPSNSTKYLVLADNPGDVRNPTRPSEEHPVVMQTDVDIDGTVYALVYNWYYLRRRFDLIFKDETGSADYIANYTALSKEGEEKIKCEAAITKYYAVPQKAGYDFLGWFDTDGNQITYEDGSMLPPYENELMPAMNTVREAHWKKSGTVNVSFDPNGGSFTDGASAARSFEKLKDSLYPTDEIPGLNERAGYQFDRWVYADGTQAGKPFDFENTNLVRDVNLKARWISMASVQVEYDAMAHGSFADGGKLSVDPEKHLDGTGVILRGAPETVDENFYFIGWQLAGTASVFKAGSAVSIVADENDKCIFKAVYDEAPADASLTYHANYPAVTGKADSEATVVKVNNGDLLIAAAEEFSFAVNGFTFQGWSRSADGSVDYLPGKEAGIDNRSANDLYGVWKANRYKLTVDPNGGTWGGTGNRSVFEMDYLETKEIEDPVWAGYVFAGWTLTPVDSASTLEGTHYTMGYKDTLLTAHWQKLKLEKETVSLPADGKAYTFGETIRYRIRLTAYGTVPVSNVTVIDEMTGNRFEIAKIRVGETRTFETSHVVTEADVLAGKVVNVATAEAGRIPVEPARVEDPTEAPYSHLTVYKSVANKPANGKFFVAGEQIEYAITVTNDGIVTLTDVVVTDDLTGSRWQVGTLRPGETSSVLTDRYVATQKDAEAGKVVNVATATGKSTDPTDPDGPGTAQARAEAPVGRTTPGKPDGKTAPKTGDSPLLYGFALLAAVSLGAAVATCRKLRTR